MLKFIKENLLIAVMSGAIGSIITLVIINHWYSKSLSDVIANWITAISSLSVAVFAGMAYKYATKQYLKNEIEKLIYKKKTRALTNICNAIIMAEFELKEQSKSIIIWMEENPDTNSMEVREMLEGKELQISSEEESKVIKLLTPFLKKINQAIYELTELDILFSRSTNDIETMLDKLKIEFSQELGRASKPFGDGQIKTRDDLQNVIVKSIMAIYLNVGKKNSII